MRTTLVAKNPASAGMLAAPKLTKFPLVPAKVVPLMFVALIVPLPETVRLPPVPMTRAAVFVPAVIPEKATEPPADAVNVTVDPDAEQVVFVEQFRIRKFENVPMLVPPF